MLAQPVVAWEGACIPELGLNLMCPPSRTNSLEARGAGKAGQHHEGMAFSPKNKGCSWQGLPFAMECGMGTTLLPALTMKLLHCGCSLPTLSGSVGRITTVGTELIPLMLWNNAAFPPTRLIYPCFSFYQEEEDNLQAAYHDLQTDTIQLEERNVFCGSYNIRVLIDQ